MAHPEQEQLKNVDATLEILEHLAKPGTKLGVREAARILNYPKSTIQKIFNSLSTKGVVYMDKDTQQYALDFGFVKLVHGFLQGNDLVTAATPVLQNLRDETSASVCLNVRVQREILTVLQYESHEPIRWSMRVGVPYPLDAGAGGKLLTAYSDLTREEIAVHLTHQQSTASSSINALFEELEQIRNQRYAISRGELYPGVTALSVPVLNGTNVVAGIGLYDLEQRMDQETVQAHLHRMFHGAQQISSLLAR